VVPQTPQYEQQLPEGQPALPLPHLAALTQTKAMARIIKRDLIKEELKVLK